jgi:hypothetical protein
MTLEQVDPIYLHYLQCARNNLHLAKQDLYFKSDASYTYVLEHVSPQQGMLYLKIIQEEFPQIYTDHNTYLSTLCSQNDLYGKPNKHYLNDELGQCSPTNARYIHHSLLILDYARKCNLDNINFVEIGGGYGGLCFFIHSLAEIFDIKTNSYTLFDLSDVCKLQEKYLDLLGVDVATAQLNTDIDLSPGSFLISNYAFSEISSGLQRQYTEQVLNPFISHGFLAWNDIDLYPFIHDKNITSIPEKPQTGPKNLYVYVEPKTNKDR